MAQFRKDVQPILKEFCYDCHGDGAKKGEVAFDELKTDAALLNHELWLKVLKNSRAGLMPPEKKPQPSAEQRQQLEKWIKFSAFGIDPKNPDPGRVTVRRLNRVEYRNTIRDLMGVDFDTEKEFPQDDSGHGFDNIGDVLTISPMLLEKYLDAAKAIVSKAVPVVSGVPVEEVLTGRSFRPIEAGVSGPSGGNNRGPQQFTNALPLSYYQAASVSNTFQAPHAGRYQLLVDVTASERYVENQFDYNKCRVVFKVDGQELLRKEFVREGGKAFHFEFDQEWKAGAHEMTFELEPLTQTNQIRSLALRIDAVTVRGPLAEKFYVRPKNYERFFSKDVPKTLTERRASAREVLGSFARQAFRGPVDDQTVTRLVALAEGVSSQPKKTFEAGLAQAMVAVLASPRFLFREEEIESAEHLAKERAADALATGSPSPRPSPSGRGGIASSAGASGGVSIIAERGDTGSLSPGERAGVRGNSALKIAATSHSSAFISEYALASRLSYFLWSSKPDEELFRLAAGKKLRAHLSAQVQRMLADPRAEALMQNFSGQWLQARDIETVPIDSRAVLQRDSGTTGNQGGGGRRPGNFGNFGRGQRVQLDGELRKAMREETERYFGHIVRADRSVRELIESDYTFLNERLARHYGLTNLAVEGSEMRRVKLPPDSERGGVLTHGTVLAVTSNPNRTSPVKRGVFILENILGTPPSPPPPDIPPLEDAGKGATNVLSLRETLALHREQPLCSSCHNRMDPLGLALENFNALGMWRTQELKQPIDAGGKLITGESFTSIQTLKHILATQRHRDFYHALTEKLLTYALGRGLEYYDVQTVDTIVERMERENGRFSALLMGIIESAPFQKSRNVDAPGHVVPVQPLNQRADIKTKP